MSLSLLSLECPYTCRGRPLGSKLWGWKVPINVLGGSWAHSWTTLSASKVGGSHTTASDSVACVQIPADSWDKARVQLPVLCVVPRPGKTVTGWHHQVPAALQGMVYVLDLLHCCKASLGQNAATLGGSRPLTASCSYTEIMLAHPLWLAEAICGGLSQPPSASMAVCMRSCLEY